MSDSFEYDVPPNQQILLQKQTEWAGLHALKEASDQLVERIEKLSQMSNVMADGGEAIGQVMRNWPHIFSVLSLNNQHRPDPNTTTEEEQAALPQLVRLAYTDESETTDKPSA